MTELVQSTKINYYQILGLTNNANSQQICKAYFFYYYKLSINCFKKSSQSLTSK
jgi:curved DNA-binding protein CbpA